VTYILGLYNIDHSINITLKFNPINPSSEKMPVLAVGRTYLSPMPHSVTATRGNVSYLALHSFPIDCKNK